MIFFQANASLDEVMMSLIQGYEVFEQAKLVEVKTEVSVHLVLVHAFLCFAHARSILISLYCKLANKLIN